MSVFLPTLLGAFLGVSLPFIIRAILDRRTFVKLIDTVFVQYETYGQHVRVGRASVMEAANRSWSEFRKNCRKTLDANFGSVIESTDLLLNQYSKYLRASDASHLIQDKRNTAILVASLIDGDYQRPNDLSPLLDALVDMRSRRTWTLFRIAKSEDLPFSQDNYNALMLEISKMKNKKMTKVRNVARFRQPKQ